jgi:tRNA pseudouridine38-40 synthase
MFNFKIIIEYDGTDYVGWQRQDNGLSIQEAIENAIFKLTAEKVILFGAGRTDAGVHALGQVAHFNLKKKFQSDNIRDGLNQYLRPQPIAILEAEQIDENFHARFSATKRTYEYIITNRRPPLTINKNKSWGVFKTLDVKKIQDEAKFFLGKHNLEAFRSAHCQSNTAIKTIDDIKVTKKNNDIAITVSAKSFLHSQVRVMVGTLVEIGKGKIKISIKKIIEDELRSQAGMTAPACGLYLIKVDY